MIVFPKEQEAGLEEVIQANASIAFTLDLKPVPTATATADIAEKALTAKARCSDPQFDLYYMTSILASVGWNKNDDIFTIEDSWNARATPVDKKFNYMHDESDIIGHITGSWVLDENGVIVTEDNLEQTGIPSRFDIVVASVLYKIWDNPELQDRMNNVIAGIEDGKWFVSMECLFKNFDYGLKDSNGNMRVIARNGDTAFLTKYLKVYGGNGVYMGEQIGRVLRNFAFSGKGLVDKPANSRSIIFNSSAETSVSNNEDKLMADATVNVEINVDELKNQLAELTQSVASEVEAKTTLMAEKNELETSVASLTTELEAAKAETVAKTSELAKATEDAAALKAELDALKAKIAEEAKAAKLKTRKTKLVSAGVADEEADTLVGQWDAAGDDLFDQFVSVFAEKKKADDEKKKKEEDAKAAEVAAKAAETAAATAASEGLENATASEEVTLVDNADDNAVEKTIARVAENLGKYAFNKNKK